MELQGCRTLGPAARPYGEAALMRWHKVAHGSRSIPVPHHRASAEHCSAMRAKEMLLMPLPSRQGLVHAGAICMGMKLGRKGNAEGIRDYLLLPVAREQQQPPSLYNSGTCLLLERKVSKQLANCNSHCQLAIRRRTVINPNRWSSNGAVFSLYVVFPSPKGSC